MRNQTFNHDRHRETTRWAASRESIFLPALAGTGDDFRAVIRNDVYQQALGAAQKVLRAYHVERKRQI